MLNENRFVETFRGHSNNRGRSVIEGAHIHIFGFTNRENKQFQRKLMRQNSNVYEFQPPQLPIFRGPCHNMSTYGLIGCNRLTRKVQCIRVSSLTSLTQFPKPNMSLV